MEYKDVGYKVYAIFKFEYRKSPSYNSIDKGWPDFIKRKDIGIECIKGMSFLGGSFNNANVYTVVDKKKWMLAKLKYGI